MFSYVDGDRGRYDPLKMAGDRLGGAPDGAGKDAFDFTLRGLR
ncbi:MAG: hypothetical protein ACQEXV_22630 [Bacillota bacterium]